jgi:hypothetical protein
LREHALADMTNELELSRSLMDIRFDELERREQSLQTLVQDSVRQALDAYILSTGSGAVSASGGKEKLIAADDELLSDDSSDEDSDSAVLRICVSENKLDRLVAQFKLPAELKSEKNEVHSVTDFYLHALRKYEKLRTVFE